MVEGLNFIIANARRKIPDFGLTGSMHACTEFAPYNWDIKIGKDGWAKQVPIKLPLRKRVSYSIEKSFKKTKAVLTGEAYRDWRTDIALRGVKAAVRAASAAPDSVRAEQALEKFKKHLNSLPCEGSRESACLHGYAGAPSGSPVEQYAVSLLPPDYRRAARERAERKALSMKM